MELATFAGGCFWCLDAVFSELPGIDSVTSGYCGGYNSNSSYEQVCTGTTGHAEVVRIGFDPSRISYAQLLDVFFAIHDPTTLNRQGADVGTQYRSSIFVHSAEQRAEATAVIQELSTSIPAGLLIVTEVVNASEFVPAEHYHQSYFAKNPDQGYCAFVINPKMATFRHNFADLLRNDMG